MVVLSHRTQQLIDRLFATGDLAAVTEFLATECADNLPFFSDSDPVSLERFRFAALKISAGDNDKLIQAVVDAQVDWRDLLMAAGFGYSVTEHERWADALLTKSLNHPSNLTPDNDASEPPTCGGQGGLIAPAE